jgi:hypothetical protein
MNKIAIDNASNNLRNIIVTYVSITKDNDIFHETYYVNFQ